MKLTTAKIAEMFNAYCEKPTGYYVAQKCSISQNTAKKYIKKENWPKKLKDITDRAIKKVGESAEQRATRHIQLGKDMQGVGVKGLKSTKPKTATEAGKLIVDGVRIERKAAGDDLGKGDANIQINVLYVKGE